jgi:SWI/SNF-related matrix-associated actin-dependent regulator of chromatin subfamily A protein 2/4
MYPVDLVRKCGKMMVLDRILVKLFHTPHRVLLFSTMTKLLDVMENYLRWRQVDGPNGKQLMKFARIDGSTALEDREEAIQVNPQTLILKT